MKMRKILALAIVLALVLPSISLNAVAAGEDTSNAPKGGLIHALLKLRFRLGFLQTFAMGRYFFRQLRPPIPIQAYPESVSLQYLNKTILQIGGKNNVTLDWESLVRISGGWSWSWMSTEIIFHFELVPPEDSSRDVWNVVFDPEYLIMKPNRKDLNWPGADTPFKTNVSIMLKPGVDPSVVTQDTIIKVSVWRQELLDKFGLLRGAPEYVKTHKEEYIQKCEESGENKYFANPINIIMHNLIGKYALFMMNLNVPFNDKWVDSTVEILVKVDKYHQAEIKPMLPIQIEPYQVKSIPVTIRNIGSHIDTYNFRVSCSDKNMIVTPPSALTLKPGEAGQALVGVAAPRTFLSVGVTSSINIEAYSVDDPETVFSNTVTLKTSGINATGASTYSVVVLIILLVIIVALVLYFLRKSREKICKKPEKPWEIPEEKKYLEKLDKKEYKKAMRMMQDEYESALLWYRYYLEAMAKKRNVERKKQKTKAKEAKIKEELKKEKLKTKPAKETKKEEAPVVEKKEETPAVEKKEEALFVVDRETEMDKRRKEQAILRIQREQEKQKNKI